MKPPRRNAGRKESPRRVERAFTLLEVVIAIAILGLALMAIFDLNAGAVAMHSYTKKLTVASLLARSKMTDIEQELYDKGFNADDEEKSGDFNDEGWTSFQWRAKILAPKTQGISPEKLIGAIFNLPLGDGSKDGLGGVLSSLFGGSPSSSSSSSSSSSPSPSSGLFTSPASSGSSPTSALGGLGPMAGLVQTQFNQMVDQLTKTVREVHLTVSWREGRQLETLDLVTHVVSMGPGSDRNGNLDAAKATAMTNAGIDPRTGLPLAQPGVLPVTGTQPQPSGPGKAK